MFGLFDRAYAFRKHHSAESATDWKPQTECHNGNGVSWYCFVPATVLNSRFLRRGIIPREGMVNSYTLNALQLVKPDPQETARQLEEIYFHALKEICADAHEGRTINLLGISLGNVISVRAAAESRIRIKRLVSIVGGAQLGVSAWESILTGPVVRDKKCSTAEEYEDGVRSFSPINYINQVSAQEVVIRTGTQDLLIPSRQGKKLSSSLARAGHDSGAAVNVLAYGGADHGAALILSALENIASIPVGD